MAQAKSRVKTKPKAKKTAPKKRVVYSQNEKRYRNEFMRNTLSRLSMRSGLIALLLVAGSFFLITHTFAGTVTRSFASEDGYVAESQPTSPFSKGSHLRVRSNDGRDEITYIRFNVSGVSGKKVNSAKLRIRSESNYSGHAVDIYLLPNLTPITGMTWNTRPSLAGAQKLGMLPRVNRWTWNEISLTRAVWADGPIEVALVGTSGDEVLFSPIESGSAPQLLFDITSPPVTTTVPPVVTIASSPGSLTTGGSTTLTWSSTNTPGGCLASGDWSGAKAVNGTEVIANMTTVKTYNFTMTCTNAAGNGIATAHATVTNGSGGGTGGTSAPTVSISASPANVTTGSASTLSWNSTNNPTSCSASGDWTGTKAASGSQSTGAIATAGTHTYNLSCTNSAGHSNASVVVVATDPSGGGSGGTTTPPTGGQVVGVPYNCTGPVNNLTVRGTGHDSRALVNLASGCTGSINFDITVDPGGGDGVKVQPGAHDLNIGQSRIVCQRYTDTTMHQDGVQVQGGSNVIFHNLTIICPYVTGQGAGGFYIDGKDFGGINNVICDGCNLEHLHYGFVYTSSASPPLGPKVPVVNSGVRNSKIHQGLLTHGYTLIPSGTDTSQMVNSNNLNVPACEGTAASPC